MNKPCTQCKIDKPLTDYTRRKSTRDGHAFQCRDCDKLRRDATKAKRAATRRAYGEAHRVEMAAARLAYRIAHQTEVTATRRSYREANKIKIVAASRAYNQANREKLNKQRSERIRNDQAFCIRRRLTTRMRSCFIKKHSTLSIVGCTSDQFRAWLAWQAEIDDVDAVGAHIDHVVPCTAFDLIDERQQFQCFNWSNMRLCDARENMVKGNKIYLELIRLQEVRAWGFILQQKMQLGTAEREVIISFSRAFTTARVQ